jgi:hypothetical protein
MLFNALLKKSFWRWPVSQLADVLLCKSKKIKAFLTIRFLPGWHLQSRVQLHKP